MSQNIEIVIAEDSPTQAEQLRFLLEDKGYTVILTKNGKEALAAVKARKPTLVISDIVMPEMDGYALCKAIKSDEKLKDLPVIIVTSLMNLQDIVMGLECGADNFIRKPYDPKALLSRINYILANSALRKNNATRMGLEIYLGGNKHFITSEREQIVDLLISSYEEAIQATEELKIREKQVSTLNAALERRADELQAANSELESFSYSVSHDLRAPLRAIQGFSRILMEDFESQLGDEGLRLLKRVTDNTVRMGKLIDDLLELSRSGRASINTSEIDMQSLAQTVFNELLENREDPAPAFIIDSLHKANGDPSLIRQVWSNLLGNAIKYSSKNSSPAINVSAYREEDQIVYCVKDNGAGFDMQYYEKLFGTFQRLHSADDFPGTGVGLAIVRRIIARHRGKVWAEAKLNEGATFYFSLPAASDLQRDLLDL